MYSISKWAFYGICILIIALPVSRHWRLLAEGNRTSGEVTSQKVIVKEAGDGTRHLEYVSEIKFQAENQTITTHGPGGIEYETGRQLTIYYSSEDPGKNCIFCASALYLTNYSVLPLILLVVWYAFYLSFNNYSKRSRPGKSRTPAFSPFRKSAQNGNTNRHNTKNLQKLN